MTTNLYYQIFIPSILDIHIGNVFNNNMALIATTLASYCLWVKI